MKTFLAIYTGSAAAMDDWKALDAKAREEREKAGIAAWNDWGTVNHKAIVEQGAPLGKTKRISSDGIADIRNNMAAYAIVRAESHEAAAKLFENHPHLTIFPGDGVEVMECLPMPKM